MNKGQQSGALDESTAPIRRRDGTGIAGLDAILGGGFPATRLYLVEGDPGSGKTTLALQFLLEGVRLGEPGIYVTLSETKDELLAVAASHSWSLDQLTIHELGMLDDKSHQDGHYSFFHPSEIELGDTTNMMLREMARVKPQRMVFDSLSEMRLLARDPLLYRRQILGLKQYFVGRNCTVLMLDDCTAPEGDAQLQSLAHGVIQLEQLAPLYGAERRRLRVIKMRGVRYRGGYHDFTIEHGGLEVYPRLVAANTDKVATDSYIREMTSTGIKGLDQLLGGGLTKGTSTLIMGPAGCGKSSFACQHATTSAASGKKVAFFAFDESVTTLFERSESIGLKFHQYVESGMILIQQIDPAELSPGAFIQGVQNAVEVDGAQVVVIDSLNGYLNAMPEEHFLVIQLHELLSYLDRKNIVTILVVAQHGMLGSGMESPVDVSYLADTVVLLRYFEHKGQIRKAISVIKKRHGKHEHSIREYSLSAAGLEVGEPFTNFHGVLTGVPRILGDSDEHRNG